MIFLKVFKSLCLVALLVTNANAGVDFSMLSGKSNEAYRLSYLMPQFEKFVKDYVKDDQLNYYWETQFANTKYLDEVKSILEALKHDFFPLAEVEMKALKQKYVTNGSVFYAGSRPLTEEELNVRKLKINMNPNRRNPTDIN